MMCLLKNSVRVTGDLSNARIERARSKSNRFRGLRRLLVNYPQPCNEIVWTTRGPYLWGGGAKPEAPKNCIYCLYRLSTRAMAMPEASIMKPTEQRDVVALPFVRGNHGIVQPGIASQASLSAVTTASCNRALRHRQVCRRNEDVG